MGDRLRQCETAVIGAGPAGLSAAIRLAESGVDTLVVDEKPEAGGQLFKQIHKFFGSERHMAGVRGYEIGRLLLDRCAELGVPILLDTAAWGIFPDRTIAADCRKSPLTIQAKQIVLATGAAENALAFPGWTLPGVMGAGAAQTLVNYQRVRPGRRALVVGAGNVGLIVAYQLLQAGIEVAAVVEALPNVGGYMVHAAKIARMGVPILVNHTIVEATGTHRVQRCMVARAGADFAPVPGTEKAFDVDLLCLAVGLSPAIELCCVLGLELMHCPELGGWLPVHDPELCTSMHGVTVAGDASGVEEASVAMEEGRLAAVTAAAALGRLTDTRRKHMAARLHANLAQLRKGPFGNAVRNAKAAVHKEFTKTCRTTDSSM